jgi:hypothetical protein
MKSIDRLLHAFVKILDMCGVAVVVSACPKKMLTEDEYVVSVRSNTRDDNESVVLVASLVAFESQALGAEPSAYLCVMDKYIVRSGLCVIRKGSIEEQISKLGGDLDG